LYVKDVADALIALIESNVVGPVNIASGCPVALREIIFKIADRLDGRELLQLGAIDMPDDDPSLLIGDITRLSKEVSWQPKYSLDQGLAETIIWWEHKRSVKR
jgi:nucleoside-diphosphate-sugar epimerase